jgi:hypothetical protein
MKIGEKIALKNLGECIIMAEYNDTVLINKKGLCYFVTNPNKKRQEEEYSYDSVVTYGFTEKEIFQLIQPLYEDMTNCINNQYKIYDKLSKIVIEAYSKSI